jgi:hypothetical protein
MKAGPTASLVPSMALATVILVTAVWSLARLWDSASVMYLVAPPALAGWSCHRLQHRPTASRDFLMLSALLYGVALCLPALDFEGKEILPGYMLLALSFAAVADGFPHPSAVASVLANTAFFVCLLHQFWHRYRRSPAVARGRAVLSTRITVGLGIGSVFLAVPADIYLGAGMWVASLVALAYAAAASTRLAPGEAAPENSKPTDGDQLSSPNA